MEEVLHRPAGLVGTFKQARFVMAAAPIVNRTVELSSRSLTLHEQSARRQLVDVEG
jgi:hypothetical protein